MSRITTPATIEAAPAGSQPLLEAVEKQLGVVPDMFRLIANSAAETEATGFRSYGNENWKFDEHGLMRLRIASINDLPIRAEDRAFHWPLGRRPDDHPGLSGPGL